MKAGAPLTRRERWAITIAMWLVPIVETPWVQRIIRRHVHSPSLGALGTCRCRWCAP